MTDTMTRDKIRRLIIQPMIDRGWTGPKGASLDAVTGDYMRLLGRYPDQVLIKAFDSVLADHKWNSWPQVSLFVAACDRHYDAPKDMDDKPADYDRIVRSRKAHEYVTARLAVNNGALLDRAFKAWCWVESKRFLFERACTCLREGREPHVGNEEIEEFFARDAA